jgi:hypothetical protein
MLLFKKNIKVKLISFTQILIKSLINPYRLIKFNHVNFYLVDYKTWHELNLESTNLIM